MTSSSHVTSLRVNIREQDQPRHVIPAASDGGGEGRTVQAQRAMQRRVFDLARLVARRQRGAGKGPVPVPVVAT